MTINRDRCYQAGACFAKSYDGKGDCYCEILTMNKPNKKCNFQKIKRDVTNGIVYPYKPHYEVGR